MNVLHALRARRAHRSLSAIIAIVAIAAITFSLAACEGCHGNGADPNHPPQAQVDEKPSLRLFLVSNLAGALEPCGCVKDQLGGFDHFAALVARDRQGAEDSALLVTGPTFFMDPSLSADKRAQDTTKAMALASALRTTGLFAFAPAKNDFAAGAGELAELTKASGATPVFANGDLVGAKPSAMLESHGAHTMKLGVIGASALVDDFAVPGVNVVPALEKVKAEAESLKKQGADAIVLLSSMNRGQAKRLADDVPLLDVIVVGAQEETGEANTKAAPVETVGRALVIETANHLQTTTILDFWKKPGGDAFVDGTGAAAQKTRLDLQSRIDELRKKIADWEKDPRVAKADIDARKKDVSALEGELANVKDPAPPSNKSFYRVSSREIRVDLGQDSAVKDAFLAYYKKVNDDNKVAFADRKPKPAGKGEASFVGIDACESCHEDPVAVWKTTSHSHAYKTLSDQFKEFNLDCVSCHVTGYDLPGGSTVTAVAALKDVQCEVCHGPGSLHMKSAGKLAMPTPKPSAEMCSSSCHHPPHVHDFDAKSKMELILGPGHGKPKK